MEAFPFTKAEWAAVEDAARPVINATLAGDPVLAAAHRFGLLEVLADLRLRHGDHPVLLETQADFTEDDAERIALYRRAAAIAEEHGLQTLSIRVSLARVLLDTGQPAAALKELLACEDERSESDESESAEWAELVAEARQANPGAAENA